MSINPKQPAPEFFDPSTTSRTSGWLEVAIQLPSEMRFHYILLKALDLKLSQQMARCCPSTLIYTRNIYQQSYQRSYHLRYLTIWEKNNLEIDQKNNS